jgi:MFS family permease
LSKISLCKDKGTTNFYVVNPFNAAYRFLDNGLAAIGPLFGGIIAQSWGLHVAFIICGGLMLLMMILFFWVVTEEAMLQASQTSLEYGKGTLVARKMRK